MRARKHRGMGGKAHPGLGSLSCCGATTGEAPGKASLGLDGLGRLGRTPRLALGRSDQAEVAQDPVNCALVEDRGDVLHATAAGRTSQHVEPQTTLH